MSTVCTLSIRSLRGFVAVVAGLATMGCTAVAPWERDVLARPQMALEPSPLRSALRSHVQASREAAVSASRAEGGGCGCSY